jgi:hypothetical protein
MSFKKIFIYILPLVYFCKIREGPSLFFLTKPKEKASFFPKKKGVSTRHSGINLETITQVIYVGVTLDFEKEKNRCYKAPYHLSN